MKNFPRFDRQLMKKISKRRRRFEESQEELEVRNMISWKIINIRSRGS